MGKTRKWLRNLFVGKKAKEKIGDSNQDSSVPVVATKEKRWSFRRSVGGTKDLDFTGTSFGLLDFDIDQKIYAMDLANDATLRAIEEASAIKIQSFFRSYLARKALNALKGLVKMQALVRGHLIRKQANETLRCMQALVKAQHRARAERIRMVEASSSQHNHRRSPHHPFENDCYEEEYVKIAEMDLRGRRHSLGGTERTDFPPQFSPVTLSMSTHTSFDHPLYPNYMANTQSSRAKLRSQSAPRQRIDAFERQFSNKKKLVEGRNIPRGISMQRSSSLVGLAGNSTTQFPWSIKLDKSDMSLIESECGSTSTLLTNKNYCRSPAGCELRLN